MGYVKKYSYNDKYLHCLHDLDREFHLGWRKGKCNSLLKEKIHNLSSLFRIWVIALVFALVIGTLRVFSSRIALEILLEYELFRSCSWTKKKLAEFPLRTCKTPNNPLNDGFTLFFAYWRQNRWILIDQPFLLSNENSAKISRVN